ncbi:MAG TPA: YfbM family protein [Planctomycetota bacterium]|nr:YfbM family protein [Planctomycetota bacterium]
MSCLGVLFALSEEDARRLLAAGDNDAVMTIIEEIEETWDEKWLVQTDKAWDALHRCLSNGTIYYDEGEYPLNRAVLGGKHLYDGDDYVVAYVAPNEVKDVAAALAPLTEKDLRSRYDAIDADDYDGDHGEEDFKATWGHFLSVREFYKKAAAEGRSVVFTVDQ